MDYKKVMGYGKKTKKKVVKEQTKSRGNKLINSIKEEFGYKKQPLKEVGASYQHQDFIKKIHKAEENLHKFVQQYKNFLMSQGHKREANEFSSKYVGFIGKFTHYMKTTWVKIMRKMI